MIDKSNEIFTRIKYAVRPLCTSASQTFEEHPAKFPHVFVDAKDDPESNTDLENNECAVSLTLEITVYTNDGIASAKKIVGLADAEMRNMGFQRIFGPQQITNMADAGITRMITRYRRLICDGDEL